MKTLTVRKLNVGDIILTSTFNKLRPMLIIKVTRGYVYGIPISTNKTDYAIKDPALNNCRFLPEGKVQYIYPMIHRVGATWALKYWVGHINPASVKKIKNQVIELIKEKIIND